MKLRPLSDQPEAPHYGGKFDRGVNYTNWRPNGRPDFLLLFTLNGGGIVGRSENGTPCGSGSLALFEPNIPQVYYTSPEIRRWQFLWAHFAPSARQRTLWKEIPETEPGVRIVSIENAVSRKALTTALIEFIHWSRVDGTRAIDFAENALERAALWVRESTLGKSSNPLDERILKCLDQLRNHPEAPFDLPSLARMSGLSVSRLSHLFKEQTGRTPQQYAEECRLSHAAHLLRLTELPVAEVGRECGYEDAYYFSTRFRRAFGQSPRNYRQSVQG